jgi:hypothetical protein
VLPSQSPKLYFEPDANWANSRKDK